MKFLLILLSIIGLCQGSESILSYQSRIKVNPDGWLDVTETIKVRVEGHEIRRGIFRDFPQTYEVKWGFREKRPFEVQSVLRNGEREPHSVTRINMGSRLRIGSANVELPVDTEQEYEIKYRTNYQLITNAGGADELNWNVTGNEWGFPIGMIEATVELPDKIEITKAFAWTGSYGEQGTDSTSTFAGNRATFASTRTMSPGEGMTVIVRWPTGLLEPAAYEKPGLFKSNPALIVGMVFVGLGMTFYLVMWFLVGRDPPKGVIIPRWEPPADFTPGGVRYLRNLKFDDRCFSAGLLGLAADGQLKLAEKNKKYTVIKEDGPPPLSPVAAVLFNKIFRYKKKVVLGQASHTTISGARNAYALALAGRIDRSYFLANFIYWLPGIIVGLIGILIMLTSAASGPNTLLSFGFLLFISFSMFPSISSSIQAVRSRGLAGFKSLFPWTWLAGVVMLVALGLFVYNAGIWVAVFYVIVFVSGFVFHHLMKQPTKKGRRILDEIEGFREYLKVAEEDRLNLENPPEKTPELFEKFLPFALALDVEQEWSEKFDEVLKAAGRTNGEGQYRPSYYTGNFSTGSQVFTGAALGGALTSALTTASTAPRSSGSSSSGGGGGFSGGGGGGGGGGGW